MFEPKHALNLARMINGRWQPALWSGFWTFFSGLVFGFVCEKTASNAAPTLFNGLPQAIVSALLRL
ncbi:hypothetical protein [Bellilinea sp.]